MLSSLPLRVTILFHRPVSQKGKIETSNPYMVTVIYEVLIIAIGTTYLNIAMPALG